MQLRDLIQKIELTDDGPDRKRLISEAAREKRRQLKEAWGERGKTHAERAGQRRAIENKVRKLVRSLKGGSGRLDAPKETWLRRRRASAVLDQLFPDRLNHWKVPHKRQLGDKLTAIPLQNFSIIDEPDQVLNSIREIAKVEASEAGALIHFKDEHCLDVAAYMVLAEVWHALLPIFRGGEMPRPVQKVLAKVGLQKALQINLPGLSDLTDVWAFPLSRRRPTDTSASPTRFEDVQSAEILSDRFCDAVNEWLSLPKIPRELTPNGRAWLKSIFGELLDNAERHSAPATRDGNWVTAGFAARRYDPATDSFLHRCHLGFLSVGATFHETLTRASRQTREKMDAYIANCSKIGCRQSAETLATLFALQDTVTSDAFADEDGRGGFGLQEVLELTNLLGGTSLTGYGPKITIVSGRSCIRLRYPYVEGRRSDGEDSPRVLWCNERNSPSVPPDPAHVFDLNHRFPGSIISITFTLDPEYLGKVDDDED